MIFPSFAFEVIGERQDGIARSVGSCGASPVECLEEAVDAGQGGLQLVDLFLQRVAGVMRDQGAGFFAAGPWRSSDLGRRG
ncbi:MAG: hypothetical protein GDA41_12000 [Rhodospirillales bacterium]|nr:hypothetical protein [Rhodospirillales bacterium]